MFSLFIILYSISFDRKSRFVLLNSHEIVHKFKEGVRVFIFQVTFFVVYA